MTGTTSTGTTVNGTTSNGPTANGTTANGTTSTERPVVGTGTVVAHLDDLAVGSLKMARVDGQRVCLARTADGVFALDHACPHEGYGLTQGSLDGDLLTCAWHNWKFRVGDGSCVVGDEGVQTHHVDVDNDGTVRVTVEVPTPEERRARLLPSLRTGIAEDRTGQIARDVVRLLRAGAEPADLVWEAVAHGAPRAEYGWGHSIAAATDCLAMVDLFEGDHRALPITQAITHISHTERHRPANPLPAPSAPPPTGAADEFRRMVDQERLTDAQALVLGALVAGAGPDEMRPWFVGAVSDHHLAYGHGAIYTQKAFQLLDRIGWHRAPVVLGHLVTTLVHLTREDTLPYVRPFLRGLGDVHPSDPDSIRQLAEVEADPAWRDDGRLRSALLDSDRRAPARATVDALRAGAGVHGVLDVVVDVVAERMLRYDVAGEFDHHDDFGWLDITHGITYANAVRWMADHVDRVDQADRVDHADRSVRADSDDQQPAVMRLTLWAAFLAHWTGRHEWHTSVGPVHAVEPPDHLHLHPDATGPDRDELARYGEFLQHQSLLDGTTAPIVHAHAVKTSLAATEEAVRIGSRLPLDATARFLAAPKLERFVAANVTRAIDFLSGRGPTEDADDVEDAARPADAADAAEASVVA